MHYQEIQLFEESPHSKLYLYLQDPEVTSSVQKKRPLLVVCPGGYVYSATREGEAIALHFLAKGYNVAVLGYRTYLEERLEATGGIPKINPQANFTGYVRDLMETMRLVNQHHDDWHVDKDNVFVMGFSAGGHLTAFLGTQWDNPSFINRFYPESVVQMFKPKGILLGYPMLKPSNMKAHPRGVNAQMIDLFAQAIAADDGNFGADRQLDVEHLVRPDMPPVFLWHGRDDVVTSSADSARFLEKAAAHGVSYESHIFRSAPHGIGLANASYATNASEDFPHVHLWTDLADYWMQEIMNEARD